MTLIREMDISDYPQVIKLWAGTEAMLLRDADSQQNIANYLDHNPGLSFVAVSDEDVIGAILVGTDGRRGYIQHLAVSTSYRGKGIGAQLISDAVNALEKQGIAKTHLFVANDNLDAQVFYKKLGWFPRDEVKMFSYNSSSASNV